MPNHLLLTVRGEAEARRPGKKTLKPNNEIKSHATANLLFNTASRSLPVTGTIPKLRRRDYLPRGKTWAALGCLGPD